MSCPTETELDVLPVHGIGVVVSLLESAKGHYQLPPGLRLIRLPIDDQCAPHDAHLELAAQLCEFIHQARLHGTGVAVHCEHGLGRTGLLLAAYRGYLAVRYPDDPEGGTPSQSILEIHRKLEELYGTAAYSLELGQVEWVAGFYRRLQNRAASEWKTGDLAEVLWQRLESGGEAAAGGVTWCCPDCEGKAWHPDPAVLRPRWCLACGWPTEP